MFLCWFVISIGTFQLCFFFKQKTAYEMRISDRSSDVCSSDLLGIQHQCAVADIAGDRAEHRQRVERQGAGPPDGTAGRWPQEIGRESCRERGCQYVWLSVVDVSLKKKNKNEAKITHIQHKIEQ